MDTQWLDDVLTLLEEGNMTRAAARRHVTQPAFSRRIRAFETWLGADVLERKTNRVDISASLSSHEGDIRALLAQLKELRRKITDYAPARTEVAIAAQHSPMSATFPDMALKAKSALPGVSFRMRAGNLSDCISLFLRGETSLLLCNEAESVGAMKFGAQVQRGVYGHDYLIPVVGGILRYAVKDNRSIPDTTPAIVYPEDSYFGSVLQQGRRPFGTPALCDTVVCQTAFSSGMREMVLSGLGVGWLPFSMVHREVGSGELISLAGAYGNEPLDVVVYADMQAPMAQALYEVWTKPG
ncbi:MAG: LysR family transcriptional regulator [Pseudomonadota bacterium]